MSYDSVRGLVDFESVQAGHFLEMDYLKSTKDHSEKAEDGNSKKTNGHQATND